MQTFDHKIWQRVWRNWNGPSHNRSWVHRTSSMLRVALARAYVFATSNAKMANQLHQHPKISLYRAQISQITAWYGLLHMLMFALGLCWEHIFAKSKTTKKHKLHQDFNNSVYRVRSQFMRYNHIDGVIEMAIFRYTYTCLWTLWHNATSVAPWDATKHFVIVTMLWNNCRKM